MTPHASADAGYPSAAGNKKGGTGALHRAPLACALVQLLVLTVSGAASGRQRPASGSRTVCHASSLEALPPRTHPAPIGSTSAEWLEKTAVRSRRTGRA